MPQTPRVAVWRNRWKSLSLPKFLLYWIQVQGRSSWQRFLVHIKYSQHNIHTMVQVHIYSAEFSVQIPNQKCSFRSSCKCYWFWYQPIKVKLVFTVVTNHNPDHCLCSPLLLNATFIGHVWIPHWWVQHASDKFGCT